MATVSRIPKAGVPLTKQQIADLCRINAAPDTLPIIVTVGRERLGKAIMFVTEVTGNELDALMTAALQLPCNSTCHTVYGGELLSATGRQPI